MSVWPRTFFGRNLLLIVGMFVVGQMGSWALFVVLVQRPRLEHFAPYVVGQTATLRAALADRDPPQRAAFLQALRSKLDGTLLVQAGKPHGHHRPSSYLVRWFFRILRPRLAADQGLLWQSAPHPVLWVRTPISGHQVYWVGFPADGFSLAVSEAVLALLGVSVAVALIGSGLIQFGLIAPLKVLESAALRVGAGEAPVAILEPLPRELERVASGFNRMQRSLAERDRERALMLAGISHDLRTPLSKLWLGIEILREQSDPEVLAQMTRSVQAADRIIEQFISFARGDATEQLELLNVPVLIRDASIDAERNCDLKIDCEPMLHCWVRPLMIRRMLANLLDNASRHGQPPLVLTAGWSAHMLMITVTDHGAGVPQAQLSSLTEPFVRLIQPHNPSSGAGLGLAIVERLARAHGGKLVLALAPHGGLQAELHLRAAADVEV